CERVLGKPALAADARFSSGPARFANREAMHREIDAVFSELGSEDLVARLDAADIANARLNDMAQFWRHPQLEARGRWTEVGSPAGRLAALKPPLNLDGVEPDMRAVPALGEHTDAVLAELGYGPAEIGRLRAEKAI